MTFMSKSSIKLIGSRIRAALKSADIFFPMLSILLLENQYSSKASEYRESALQTFETTFEDFSLWEEAEKRFERITENARSG